MLHAGKRGIFRVGFQNLGETWLGVLSRPPFSRARARPFLNSVRMTQFPNISDPPPFRQPPPQPADPIFARARPSACGATQPLAPQTHSLAAPAPLLRRQFEYAWTCAPTPLEALFQEVSPPSANVVAFVASAARLWRLGPPERHAPNRPLVGALGSAPARGCPCLPRFLSPTATEAAPSPRAIPRSCRHRSAPPAHLSQFPLATESAR